MKTSMKHNKYLTPELNDPISAKSAAKILSLYLTYTSHVLNFFNH